MEKDITPQVLVVGFVAFIVICFTMDHYYPPVDQKGDREITVKYQDRVQ